MSNKILYLIMRGFGRFLKEFRLNILSLLTLCTLIFVYHIFCTAGTGIAGFLSHIAATSTVRVYLKTDTGISHEEILKKIEEIDGVVTAEYFSPKAAKEYVIANAPGIKSMKSFSDDFFPAFIEAAPEDPTDKKLLDGIEAIALKIVGVDSVSYGKEFISKFLMVSAGAWMFLIITSIFFAVSVAFVIYNTVKLTLYKSREEIKLYSLVGGTRPFISVPYVFAAFLQGVTAYTISSLLFIAVFTLFNSKIMVPAGINIFSMPGAGYFISAFLFVCLFSVGSAYMSITSFLRKVSSINED